MGRKVGWQTLGVDRKVGGKLGDRFEDTKGVTRSRKSKKDRQMAKRKRTHIYLQNTTQNLKIVQHQPHENIFLLAPPPAPVFNPIFATS